MNETNLPNNKRTLPSVDEIIYALSEEALGRGEEATVFKIHTNPDYTVRVSRDAPNLETLSEMMYALPFIDQKDVFDGRNFAQAVAYLKIKNGNPNFDKRYWDTVLITINLYSPGFSMEIYKPKGVIGEVEPSSEVALMKTIALSKAVAEMPDKAFDKLYDDLHFLSSREYSIDTGNGFFTNMGNILLSGKDKEFSIIDVQPFIRERVGINRKHTKGFNTPFYLTHGLVPGMYKYRQEHSKTLSLIEYRTEIIDKIIKGAQRNHLNDVNSYSTGSINVENLARPWKVLLESLCIPEKYHESFIRDILSVKQEDKYSLIRNNISSFRVSGREMGS